MSGKEYSVSAILKATDAGFSKTFKAAERSMQGLGSITQKAGNIFKSTLGANLVSSAIVGSIGAISNGVQSMVGELNSASKTWQTFEGNMKAFGKSGEEINQVKSDLQKFARDTIYSASDMASTYSQLAAVGTKNTTELVKGFGYLASAAENPQQAMKTLSTQATQMAAKPKVAWQDFKLILEQTPAGVSKVAEAMGMSTEELIKAVQDGKVETQAFFDAIVEGGKDFKDMAENFKTVDQAIDGLSEGLTNSLQPAFEKVNQFGLKALKALSSQLDKVDFSKLADSIGKFLDGIDIEGFISSVSAGISSVITKVQTFWTAFSNTGAVSAFVGAIQSVSGALGHVWESLNDSGTLNTLGSILGNVVKWLSQAATGAAKFINSLSPGTIRTIVSGIAGAVAGFKLFNFLQSFNPFSFFKKNAEEATQGVGESVKKSKSTIAQVFNGISTVVKSVGNALKSTFEGLGKMFTGLGKTFEGVGKGLGAALKGLMQGLKGLNPATLISFGAAIAVAAVGIGAGVAIIAAGFALLATQSQGVATIIQAVGTAFGTLASMIIGAFAQAIVTVAGVLPTIATAFSMMSPAIIAAGIAISMIINAFSSLAPVIIAVGIAISQIVSSLGTAIAEILTAVTPIVEIISTTFTQIVADAIVQIVQALAPFIPAVSEMVQAVAPVVQGIVDAFTNLVNQISPIIESIKQLFQTLGEQISSILDHASGVVDSFGSAVRSVLDGIAGIFDSIGNAALNAGKGFKLLADGVVKITSTNLGDMAASLGAVAVGVGAIASHSGNMAGIGQGMKTLGQGLVLVQASGMGAVTVLQSLANALPAISSSLIGLAPTLTTVATALSTFATSSISSMTSLTMISSVLLSFNASLTAVHASITTTGGAMIALGSNMSTLYIAFLNLSTSILQASTSVYNLQTAMYQTASAVISISQGFSTLQVVAGSSMASLAIAVVQSMSQSVSATRSGMSQMVAVVRSSASQMTQAGQQAGRGVSNGVTSGIRSGIGSATAAMSAMMSAVRSAGMAGVGSMRNIGSMIGQGLAQGMYSALGSVTAAANALVAQAERAARAKAQIHSPSRLFRNNVGIYIGQGVAVGINRSRQFVNKSMQGLFDNVKDFGIRMGDIIDGTFGNQFAYPQLSGSVEMKQGNQRQEELGLLKRALETIGELVDRDIVLNINGREFARATGDDLLSYQQDKNALNNLFKGIRNG